MQTDATGHNIIEPNDVGNCWYLLALVAWCMQMNATTDNNVGGHLQYSLQCACADVFTTATLLWLHANGRNIAAQRFAGHRTTECAKVWPVSNYTQQVPTMLWFHANERNMLGPIMLHVVGQQCCVRLNGPVRWKRFFNFDAAAILENQLGQFA